MLLVVLPAAMCIVCVGPSRDELEVSIDKADVVVDAILVPGSTGICVRRSPSGFLRSMNAPIVSYPLISPRA